MINVTKTFLPPLEEYSGYLRKIWANEWITNNGECAIELEEKLKGYLGVKHLVLVNNGTIALQIAIKALGLEGEIITTPFSYVATTSSIVWEGCKPVFADIDPGTLCIDPANVEAKISNRTSAILATHVYGNPCDVERLQRLGEKHQLPIVYDAAHAFGVKLNNKSVLQWGDVSTLSFHATKVFHTVEGGALVTNDDELAHRIQYMRNFGHNGPEQFWGVGINGKISEMHAAMGLVNLKHIDRLLKDRKEVATLYDVLLEGLPIQYPMKQSSLTYNYAYYPIILRSEGMVLRLKSKLNEKEIFPRRYFFPSLNTLPYVDQKDLVPASEDVTKRVLCLPLYADIDREVVRTIAASIKECFAM